YQFRIVPLIIVMILFALIATGKANADHVKRKVSALQSYTISGSVTDSQGGALSGVTVSVTEANVSASTGADGKYKIDVSGKHDTLGFASVGYIAREVLIAGRQVVNVELSLDNEGSDEVVVVGFGTQKKESLVASVSTVRGDQLRMPNRSLSNNLAGQLPGVI